MRVNITYGDSNAASLSEKMLDSCYTTVLCCVLYLCQALDAVLEMSMSQNLSSAATEIVANHLHFVPPVVPSQDVLGKLCSLLHQEGQHQDLFTIVERLLQCRVAVLVHYMCIWQFLSH